MSSSITKSFAWSAVDKFSNLGIQFVLGVIIARLITPEEYGVLGILMVFINISQVFIDSGLGSALIYKNKIDDNYLNTSFVFNLGISVILFIIIFSFAPFIESFFSFSGLSEYIKVSSLVLITNSLIVVPTSILKIQLNFRALAISNTLSTIISGALGVISAYLGYGVWALIIQLLSRSLFLLFFLYLNSKWIPKLYFNKDVFSELYRYGINIFCASCLTKILDEGTSFLVGKFLTPYNLGLYSKGRQFSCLPGNTVGGIITTALFPSLSSIKDDEKRFFYVYHYVIEIQTLICFPLFVWLAVFADPLVRLLLTEKWMDVVRIIQILSIGRLLSSAATVTEEVLNAKGYSDVFFRQQLWKMIMKTSIICCCLPFGLHVVVIGEAIFTLLAYFLTNHIAKDISKFGISKQLKIFFPYLFSSLVGGGLSYWIINIIESNVAKIFTGSLIFFFTYICILCIFFYKRERLRAYIKVKCRI